MTDTIPARPFKQVDVFTDRPGYGNPVAVILAAEGLSDEAMLRLARWTNLSETTFLLPSDEADYHLRIFCPGRELPFAGHPTIGSAHAAMEAGLVADPDNFTMLCGLGKLALRREGETIWVRTPHGRAVELEIDIDRLTACLGGAQPDRPQVFDTGPYWLVGGLGSVDELRGLDVDLQGLIQLCREMDQTTGVILHAFTEDGGLEVRAFAPAAGVGEDPVCGSGNLAAAAHLKMTGELARVGSRYQARQGMNLDRDGRLELNVMEDGVELGGRAVTVFDGTARY